MNSADSFTDPTEIQQVINSVIEAVDSDDDLPAEIANLQNVMNSIRSLNNSNNPAIKYRYPYNTAIRPVTLAEPITEEILRENNIPADCRAYSELLDAPGFYSLTQLQPTEFVELLKLLQPTIDNSCIDGEIKANDDDPLISANNNSRPSRRKLIAADRLLCWLIQLGGDRDIIVSRIMNTSVRTVTKNFGFITDIVNTLLAEEMTWPDENERKLLYDMFPIYKKAIAVVDGTHCEIKIPGDLDDEDSYYSAYKHKHTQLYLIYIDPHGFFRKIEGPWEGSNVDRGVFIQSEIYKNTQNYLVDDERILADGGFGGDGPILFPYNKIDLQKAGDKKPEYQAYNELLTESRSLVEHAIHRLKARASMLVGRFPKDKVKQHKTVIAAALIFNWTRRIRIIQQQQRK